MESTELKGINGANGLRLPYLEIYIPSLTDCSVRGGALFSNNVVLLIIRSGILNKTERM